MTIINTNMKQLYKIKMKYSEENKEWHVAVNSLDELLKYYPPTMFYLDIEHVGEVQCLDCIRTECDKIKELNEERK